MSLVVPFEVALLLVEACALHLLVIRRLAMLALLLLQLLLLPHPLSAQASINNRQRGLERDVEDKGLSAPLVDLRLEGLRCLLLHDPLPSHLVLRLGRHPAVAKRAAPPRNPGDAVRQWHRANYLQPQRGRSNNTLQLFRTDVIDWFV